MKGLGEGRSARGCDMLGWVTAGLRRLVYGRALPDDGGGGGREGG